MADKPEPTNKTSTELEQELGPGVPGPEDREVTCPSCFRFVGTYEKCPYCGAEVWKRISVRAFRWGSLLFALVGLLLLWMSARGIKAPLVKVHELEPTMSMGLVRIAGRVVNEPRLHPEWQSLYVQLDDGTGEVAINAYKEVATVIMESHPPRRGDVIEVQGMVRFQSGGTNAKLLCQAPQHLRVIERAPGPESATYHQIGAVTERMEGTPIIVKGTLSESGLLPFGAYRGILQDPTGDIVVWVEPHRWPKFDSAAKALLTTGAELQVRGSVVLYYNKAKQTRIIEVVPDDFPNAIVALK